MTHLRPLLLAILAVALAAIPAEAQQTPAPKTQRTQVVLLATGTPPADPDRSGAATAVVVNGTAYLVHHTTTSQLVELANKARPKLLVLYHASISLRPAVDPERSSPAVMLGEMAGYRGLVVVGRDLDVY